jgi:hypothetical protein
MSRIFWTAMLSLAMLLFAGCTTGQVEFTAADAIDQIAGNLATGIEEYHGEVLTADARRTEDVIDAFSARLLTDAGNAEQHKRDVLAALTKINTDGQVENVRHGRLTGSVAALKGLARDIRGLAVDTVQFNDEARRYLRAFISKEPSNVGPAADPAGG